MRGIIAAVSYDLFGDIHGHSEPLEALLAQLGYHHTDGVYRRPDRQVIFLGDFIDRGPNQREVIDIVRPMIDSGAALSVMGNHEFNAIAWHTEDPYDPYQYLREHTARHRRQHQAFLDAYQGTADHAELIEWFRTLPMWLDLGELRVVHACWDDLLMQALLTSYPTLNEYLDDELLVKASRKDALEHEAVEILLKGKEIELPQGHSFLDKDGHARHAVRIRWFDADSITYQAAFLGPEKARSHIPEDPIGADHIIQYSHDDPPVFFGHYWLDDGPELLTRLAQPSYDAFREPQLGKKPCLDYSVASEGGGKLVAYRWDGEQRLDDSKFVFVDRKAARLDYDGFV